MNSSASLFFLTSLCDDEYHAEMQACMPLVTVTFLYQNFRTSSVMSITTIPNKPFSTSESARFQVCDMHVPVFTIFFPTSIQR